VDGDEYGCGLLDDNGYVRGRCPVALVSSASGMPCISRGGRVRRDVHAELWTATGYGLGLGISLVVPGGRILRKYEAIEKYRVLGSRFQRTWGECARGG